MCALTLTNITTLKECQEKLVDQLISQIQRSPGPPTRNLIGRCLASLFSNGDTLYLYKAINTCNDILKSKDDGPPYLNIRLTAINCLGTMYERLGRLAESQTRYEIMLALHGIVHGLGYSGYGCHKEIYKAAKNCMTDRAMPVRAAAAKCIYALVDYSQSLHTTDLEATVNLCLRSMESSSYEVRLESSRLLGHLLARTQGHSFKGFGLHPSSSLTGGSGSGAGSCGTIGSCGGQIGNNGITGTGVATTSGKC
ncbi:unnamed protein product [Protopolystoma xenopodis]|uniref:Uncharacterized protein n=1 Tax=Protopolystoma xenopodis TaxID=117903 RepID=A0A3S5C835_9PLAT|nr:unnamed protein product [Protopolystoma xenopodis]